MTANAAIQVIAQPLICQGRLSYESGQPNSWNRSGSNCQRLFWIPMSGNRASLYNVAGNGWYFATWTNEIYIDLTGLTAGGIYDIFLVNTGTVASPTLALKLGTAWASTSARVSGSAGEVVLQDGAWVNKYLDASGTIPAKEGRYLGTLRCVTGGGSSQGEDSLTKRYLYNCFNQLKRSFMVAPASLGPSTTVNTYVSVSGSSVAWLSAFGFESIDMAVKGDLSLSAGNISGYVGLYSDGSVVGIPSLYGLASDDTNLRRPIAVCAAIAPSIGVHNADIRAQVNSACTWFLLEPQISGSIIM